MSLLDVVAEEFEMIDKSTVSDGYGGFVSAWATGAKFTASLSLDDSLQAQTAQANGVTGVYTVVTGRNVTLQYHDVFRRATDKKVFRVVTDGDDKKTPATAGLNMRAVRAEEWTVPGTISVEVAAE